MLLWETETGTPRGSLVALRNGMNLMLSLNVDRELVYITVTDAGQQVLSPAEFSQKYGWKNDPTQVKLLAP